ncbi:BamA/TamA family outer membrane protein [Chitinophagaceae bacterium LB-8]|uniref:BamA/TamA family outer membrane protein n=1 Tax=Paraflavisolibacter caeni TaxID=2982496 RepID=A0A9X2XTF9_9BACT|nr:BamA/TamA family outer membrane protein [Paraflavisolibacter caeni]MCU7548027.1 BamA/TamA family outer membrane protein [Paraflavisolibacter caeni]
MHLLIKNCKSFAQIVIVVLSVSACCLLNTSKAQKTEAQKKDTVQPMDISDVFLKITKRKADTLKLGKKTGIALLPSFGYNPSFGFIIGAKISGGKQNGSPENTIYSVYGLEGFYSSKGIKNVQFRHNLFTAQNRWNWQGNWQIARYGQVDYGLGTKKRAGGSGNGFNINELPTKIADSAYPIKYTYLRLFEKLYRKIAQHWFVGAGININMFSNIEEEKNTNLLGTPHKRYSLRNGFDTTGYSLNGFILTLQYNTREHPVRSYGGIYADLSFCFNPVWLGSNKQSLQLQYEFRKYWSLSKRNPEHVIALWHWASYELGGELPYLGLPGTASDTYGRSGRGYTLGYFKGPSYAYLESEYRFPILRNKFLSGVCFFNLQSASDDNNTKVFDSWEPGGGVGLRVLFKKQGRITLCADFAKGKYGSDGIFFGLNEVF